MDNKTKKTCILVYKIFFILVVMPALLSLSAAVGFWIIYLCLTHPVLAEYQTQLSFRMGIFNIAIGICAVQIIIILKSINHVFDDEIKTELNN
jgi:hypothetical protein